MAAFIGVLVALWVLGAVLDAMDEVAYAIGSLYWAWWYGPYRGPTVYVIIIVLEIYALTYLARELL